MVVADFNQIKRSEHLPAQIATRIGKEILEGRIAAGEKLPTEHLLAKTFGVSRSVIREAIAQLRNEGLVETRQGVGAFATEFERRHSLRIEHGDPSDRLAFQNLYQLRIPLEIEAAGLAALHHTPDDLQRINEALEQMTGVEKWTEQGIVADLAFHRAVATATQNEYFPLFIGFISERISRAIQAARDKAVLEEIVEVTIAEHVRIREAINAGKQMDARDAMRNHLTKAAARLDLSLDALWDDIPSEPVRNVEVDV